MNCRTLYLLTFLIVLASSAAAAELSDYRLEGGDAELLEIREIDGVIGVWARLGITLDFESKQSLTTTIYDDPKTSASPDATLTVTFNIDEPPSVAHPTPPTVEQW